MDTAARGPALGRFWAGAVGGELRTTADDPVGDVVVPGVEHGGIALCPVPEARTVKHRVHLDVYTASLASLEALGATVLLPAEQSGLPWTVMADPEGGELCAFLRAPAELPAYLLHGVVVDCADPERVATWWAERFGCAVDDNDGRGYFTVHDVPGMPIATFDFVPVPEPKTVKNRIHWDVFGAAADFEAAGATRLRRRDDEISWDVLADPEGNEFCVFTPRG
ncbi:VOC family protein [Nocardioides mesophilus]|uniref:VOC family protein n=2 Tax=Nocardioides mesophilus TaxID=433659 RepID=A0A7G9RHI3_9ACTN|nr:VOC family protein [Nocardioides mesophilus]